MALLESMSPFIGGDHININEYAAYVPSLDESRTKAVLFSGSLIFDRRHPEFVLPQVNKEDVLHADAIYAQKLAAEDAYGLTLAEEREKRISMWSVLGLDTELMQVELANFNRIRAVTSSELVKPFVSMHLQQERKVAEFILRLTD